MVDVPRHIGWHTVPQSGKPVSRRRSLLAWAAVGDPIADAVVRQMRDAIIDTDLKLLTAVNSRLQLVARLRAYKTEQGMDFVDPAREEWMHRYLQGANQGPLSAEGLREIYGHLLELTKRETARETAAREAAGPT
jgi:chorismate mutase